MQVEEHNIDCPYCGETITILVDPSVSVQAYVEDCQVCCRPIEVSVAVPENEVATVLVRGEDDTL